MNNALNIQIGTWNLLSLYGAVCVHAPTDDKNDNENLFYNSLNNFYDELSSNDIQIISQCKD